MITHKSAVWFLAIAVVLVLVVNVPAARASEPLAGGALRAFIIGKRIYLKAPLGGELPLYYRADGVVNGSGEAVVSQFEISSPDFL